MTALRNLFAEQPWMLPVTPWAIGPHQFAAACVTAEQAACTKLSQTMERELDGPASLFALVESAHARGDLHERPSQETAQDFMIRMWIIQ